MINLLTYSQKNKYEDVIKHYKNKGAQEKLKAAEFLLSNITYHKSIKSKWFDKNNIANAYDEFSFENYLFAKEALEIAKKEKTLHPKLITTSDKNIISSDFLIKNIDLAFKDWKENPWSKQYSFEDFCEYLLPYRSLIEPLEENWREELHIYHAGAISELQDKNDPVELCTNVIHQMKHFAFVWKRIDPQPLLSLSQLLFRREGNCPDLANYSILANRALGVATTMDFTPHFAASSNRHFWNTVIDTEGNHIPFNANQGDPYTYNANYRRMGKVLRRTFSKQKNSLAAKINKNDIPSSFISDITIKDVTDEYIETSDIHYNFMNPSYNNINYLSVFNKGKWRVLWWGEEENNTTTFRNMGQNIVYLPTQVIKQNKKNKLIKSQYPILLDSKGKSIILKPNFSDTFSGDISKKEEITVNNKDYNTLEFENSKKLSLFYWDMKWRLIDTYNVQDQKIVVKNIPKNALFRLLPEVPDSFERIFILKKDTYQMVIF